MTREEAFKLTPEKSYIMYAKGKYRVASVFEEFGVTWIEIYDEPPSLHVDRIQVGSCSLPPAEGAEPMAMDGFVMSIPEAEIQWAGYGPLGNIKQQPTAEGAEEFLCRDNKNPDTGKIPTWDRLVRLNVAYGIEGIPHLLQEFATLHAQRIADKMVEERLREELINVFALYFKTNDGRWLVDNSIELIDEYLKSRER